MEDLNLIVVKWGNLYNAQHVINLYSGAKRYTTVPFKFYVFTDDSSDLPQDLNWHFVTLPEYNVPKDRGWWYKMEIFNQDHSIRGINLYIDLDVIIVNDLAILWDLVITNKLYICRDFNRYMITSYQACNSSVMGWRNSNLDYAFREFIKQAKQNMEKYRGDQDFIQGHTSKMFWPDSLAMSWKWECWRGGRLSPTMYKTDKMETLIGNDTRILVFHGQPKPENCEDPYLVKIWNGEVKHS